ncbi:hypothetical protein C8Q80DRAFT_882739 [Daedaleopsis nitida]|nr:hypothetical protein C8Q80DRAFT_882739 [Daedaleopsis nitida]
MPYPKQYCYCRCHVHGDKLVEPLNPPSNRSPLAKLPRTPTHAVRHLHLPRPGHVPNSPLLQLSIRPARFAFHTVYCGPRSSCSYLRSCSTEASTLLAPFLVLLAHGLRPRPASNVQIHLVLAFALARVFDIFIFVFLPRFGRRGPLLY